MKHLVNLLNKQLADTIDLRLQARQARFNVRGPYARELGSMFDGLAGELRWFGDLISQRIGAVGGHPAATVRFVASESNLPDFPTDAFDARDHLDALLSSYSRFEMDTQANIKSAKGIGDFETVRLLQMIAASIENDLWFLEAYFEGIAVGLHGRKLPPWTPKFDRGERAA
jgi:starvation-inducible DNA-binding protein